MELINVGIAGCLGRMGRELVKKSIEDTRINFAGGFEHPEHNLINKNLSEILEGNLDELVTPLRTNDESKKLLELSNE